MDEIETKRKQVQELREALAKYYVFWVKSGNPPPKTDKDLISGADGPDHPLKKVIMDLNLALGDSGDGKDLISKENLKKTDLQLAFLDVEERVGKLSRKLQMRDEEITKEIEGSKLIPDDAAELLGRYLRSAMKSTVYIMAEGLEFIQDYPQLKNSPRRRWFIIRGIKAVFFYYVKTYMQWGIEWKVIPERSPSKALQKIAFQGYDFSGLLKDMDLDMGIKSSIHSRDPLDPVKAYTEVLWYACLVALGYHLFPDTPFPSGVGVNGKKRDELDAELLDADTNKFIDELYDSFIQSVGKSPASSASLLGRLIKHRFVDITLNAIER